MQLKHLQVLNNKFYSLFQMEILVLGGMEGKSKKAIRILTDISFAFQWRFENLFPQ